MSAIKSLRLELGPLYLDEFKSRYSLELRVDLIGGRGAELESVLKHLRKEKLFNDELSSPQQGENDCESLIQEEGRPCTDSSELDASPKNNPGSQSPPPQPEEVLESNTVDLQLLREGIIQFVKSHLDHKEDLLQDLESITEGAKLDDLDQDTLALVQKWYNDQMTKALQTDGN